MFLFKPDFLHESRRFYFPPRYVNRWRRDGRAYTSLFWEGEVRAREKVIVAREEMEKEIERIVRSVRGDTLVMKYARLRHRTWEIGVRCADQLAVRDALRAFIERIRVWR